MHKHHNRKAHVSSFSPKRVAFALGLGAVVAYAAAKRYNWLSDSWLSGEALIKQHFLDGQIALTERWHEATLALEKFTAAVSQTMPRLPDKDNAIQAGSDFVNGLFHGSTCTATGFNCVTDTEAASAARQSGALAGSAAVGGVQTVGQIVACGTTGTRCSGSPETSGEKIVDTIVGSTAIYAVNHPIVASQKVLALVATLASKLRPVLAPLGSKR